MTRLTWSRWCHVAALAVCVVVAYLYAVQFLDLVGFNQDVERDLERTLGLLRGEFPWRGPDVGKTGFHLGPVSYVVLALPVAISPDPLWIHWFVVLCAAAGALLVFLALRTIAADELALLGSVLLVASGYWSGEMAYLWHPALLPGVMGGILYSLASYSRDGRLRWLAGAVGLASLGVQLHPAFVVALVSVVALAMLWDWRALFGLLALGPLATNLVTFTVYGEPHVGAEGLFLSAKAATLSGYLAPFWGNTGHPISQAIGLPVQWTLLGLALVGITTAVRRRHKLTQAMALMVVLGVPFLLLALERDLPSRHVHAVMAPLIGLAMVGLGTLTARVRLTGRRATTCAAAALVLLAGVNRTSGATRLGMHFCNMESQRSVALWIVDQLGALTPDEASDRVHGLPCRGAHSGWRYFYTAAGGDRRDGDDHVFLTKDRSLGGPAALAVVETADVGPYHAVVYQPAIDYSKLTSTITTDETRQVSAVSYGVVVQRPFAVGRVTVPLLAPIEKLTISPEGAPACHSTIRATGKLTLEVTVGPCAGLEGVDVY